MKGAPCFFNVSQKSESINLRNYLALMIANSGDLFKLGQIIIVVCKVFLFATEKR